MAPQLNHLDVLDFGFLLVLFLEVLIDGRELLHRGAHVVDLCVLALEPPRHLLIVQPRAAGAAGTYTRH